jgi:hypothetical protein
VLLAWFYRREGMADLQVGDASALSESLVFVVLLAAGWRMTWDRECSLDVGILFLMV